MYHQSLKLGFIGLGKYGFATAKAILKSGHHNIEDIYFAKTDDEYFRKLPAEKVHEIKDNYENLRKLLSRFKNENDIDKFLEGHILSINELIEKVCKNKGSKGILIISLDMFRGKILLEKIAGMNKKISWEDVWILSSVSKLEVSIIKQLINNNIRVIRYIQNMAISVGQGIISAYIEPVYYEEGEFILKRIFQGCGKVMLVDEEASIDAARIITASTIGIFTYFAKILSDSIKELGIKNFEEEADEIVYHSIAGMLSLCKGKEIESWDKLFKYLLVSPGKLGEPGTIEFITDDLNNKNISHIIIDSIKKCHKKYLHNNQIIEV